MRALSGIGTAGPASPFVPISTVRRYEFSSGSRSAIASRYAAWSSVELTSPRSINLIASSLVRRSVSITSAPSKRPPGAPRDPYRHRSQMTRTCLQRDRAGTGTSSRNASPRGRSPRRDAEGVVLPVRRVRERLLDVQGQVRLVLGPDVRERQRVLRGLDLREIELGDLPHCLEDRVQLAREPFELLVGQLEPRQPGNVHHFVSRDRHRSPSCQTLSGRFHLPLGAGGERGVAPLKERG